MERSSIIASVVAAGGILIAGSVASAAVINASASVEPEGMSHTIVAEPASLAVEPVADISMAPEVTGSAPSLTEVVAEELPIVTVPDVTVTAAAPAAPAPAAAASTPKPAKTSKPKPAKATAAPEQSASAPSSSSAAAPQVRAIPVDTAVSMVLTATGGGVVQNAVKTSRAGYDAWAVTVLRHDGSVITGYVDQVQGVVYDWAVVKEAPNPAPAAGGGTTSGGGSSYSDDDHDDDHGDDHDGDHDDD